MIDIEKVKLEFDNYTKNYDLNDEDLNRKYHHSYRVMKISEEIARSLNLEEEEIKIAQIIGLFHDIARFEQWTKYHTFSDSISVDHGDFAVEILQRENIIRKFIKENDYDNIILKAIKNHNKFKIEEGLTSKELLFSKIIRDADKIDIFFETLTIFFYNEPESKEELENGIISEKIMEEIKKKQLIYRTREFNTIERFIASLCFVFDLNFEYSFKILQKEDYINKIIDRFKFANTDTNEKMEQIRKIINDYIQENKG